jgi:hypothetical protein
MKCKNQTTLQLTKANFKGKNVLWVIVMDEKTINEVFSSMKTHKTNQ